MAYERISPPVRKSGVGAVFGTDANVTNSLSKSSVNGQSLVLANGCNTSINRTPTLRSPRCDAVLIAVPHSEIPTGLVESSNAWDWRSLSALVDAPSWSQRIKTVPGTFVSPEPVGWPDGTQVEVVPIPPAAASQAESYRDFILRLAGSFGDEPFERPPQGDNEQREAW